MSDLNIGMIFGAQYFRPPFPTRDCWRRDLGNMRDLGFNTVKLWAVWNWIEREPGVYTFDDLDELLDLALEFGLKVVINTIPEGAPYWIREGNEDAYYQTARGEKVTYGGPANLPTAGWPGLCMDKAAAAALVERFIETLAAHVKDHPAMFAIDVWNEPHLEPMFDYRSDMLCYCEHSKERFRIWLREKYHTLAELNRVWFRTYTSWEQIDPPPRIGTWTDMMDWRMFWLCNMQRWMRLRVAAARRGAPDLLVQSHVAYSGYVGTHGTGGLANELGDEFLLSREVDVFGLTCFPKWLMRENPFLHHMMNHEIVAAASGDKPFYQVELQGGGGKAGLLGGEVPTARDIRLWNYGTAAAGGKGVTYWQYAPEPAGVESPGFGLTGFRGENTERSFMAGECAKELNHPLLARARRVVAQNAIYLSRTASVWFYSAERREELYAQAVQGFYQAAFQNCIPITFVHQDEVENINNSGIRTLFLPVPTVLSKAETDALERFVISGGTLVSEAFPGLYDETGLLDQESTVLMQLFGLEHVEVQGLGPEESAAAIKDNSILFRGTLYRQVVRPSKGTEVKAVFSDGAPAMTERRMGQGKAVWLGTFAGIDYAKTQYPINEAFIAGLMQKSGYPQFHDIIATEASQGLPCLAPLVRLLETEEAYIIVAVNYMIRPANIHIVFTFPWEGKYFIDLELDPSECTWQSFAKP
jgi:beta-galactosidase GanA